MVSDLDYHDKKNTGNYDNNSVTSGSYISNTFNNDLKLTHQKSMQDEGVMESEEERKRFFLSMVYNLKFKYADKITNKKISVNDLYLKAKAQNIQKEDWYIFIFSSLEINQADHS